MKKNDNDEGKQYYPIYDTAWMGLVPQEEKLAAHNWQN